MSIKNLKDNKAQKKLENLVNTIKIAMVITDLNQRPLNAIPLGTKQVDSKGDIWFLSHINSQHNLDLSAGDKVQLLYNDPIKNQYISIYGTGKVITDSDILHQLYDEKEDKIWFEGPMDPLLSAIRITPEEAHYWDGKNNKFIELFKKGWAALSGGKADLTKQGNLNL